MIVGAVSIGNSFQTALNNVFSYLPKILGFLVILVIGYLVAKVVKTIVNKILDRVKIDDRLQKGKAGSIVGKVSSNPSHLLGALAFWLIFVYVLSAAIAELAIPSLTTFMTEVLAYIPNVIAAILIFVVAAVIAGAVVAAVQRTMGDTSTGKLVETIVPALVMAIAFFMILTQLKIAPSIVMITYAALIGMLALAGALAFGLGGREVAGQMWRGAYLKGQDQTAQVKADMQAGKDRAQAQAGQARDHMQASTDGQGAATPGAPTPGARRV